MKFTSIVTGLLLSTVGLLCGCSEYPQDFANEDMMIIDLEKSNVTTSTANFSFITSKKGKSQIYYKRISSVEKVQFETTESLVHSITLENLVPQRDYYCRIVSQNEDGYKAEVEEFFTTKPWPPVYPMENELP